MLARVLVMNVAVAVVKLTLGYATGAVSIVSDGFQSLTDSASNVIGLVGMRIARKPPDADHPYGHRKFETLAAAGIFVFMLLAVLEIGRSALAHYLEGVGLRATGRLVGVSHNAVMNWVLEEVEGKALAAARPEEWVEADELWTYVGQKNGLLAVVGY